MKTPCLALILLAAGAVSAAHAQRANDPASVWRAKVLGAEGRLHDDPDRDFDGTIGPMYIFKNGLWYTSDMSLVYFEGKWVSELERTTVISSRTERRMVIKPAPAPEG